ncbi:hypothetical protein SDC9_166611 [bioreactor metagenome]|uniref:Uncharacterized protein n=1 Tax=bioreactor metagenome TaxID=1076179 RepID=A0A645G524_9ZZZZ
MSSLRFLSALSLISASRRIFSISSSLRRDDWIVMFWALPVALSFALTWTMPLASMSKVTSICGMPRGAGLMPSRKKRPSETLSPAIARSPCRTWISTCGWLSAAVVNTWLLDTGIAVFFSIIFVKTPPSVSRPSESGVTSTRTMPCCSPARIAPWIAAPIATHSSGLMPLLGSLPMSSVTSFCTIGIRVEPPTRRILLI